MQGVPTFIDSCGKNRNPTSRLVEAQPARRPDRDAIARGIQPRAEITFRVESKPGWYRGIPVFISLCSILLV